MTALDAFVNLIANPEMYDWFNRVVNANAEGLTGQKPQKWEITEVKFSENAMYVDVVAQLFYTSKNILININVGQNLDKS